MGKKILIPSIFIFSLIILIFIIIMSMLNTFGSKKYKIMEIKKFPAIAGFTFNYPIFKDWEIPRFLIIDGSFKTGTLEFKEMKGFINCPIEVAPGGAPYISVKKQKLLGLKLLSEKDITEENIRRREAPSPDAKKNPRNVLYDYYPEDNFLQFYGENFGAEIKLSLIPKDAGFSSEEFIKKIIETFIFFGPVSQEEALEIAIEYSNFIGASWSDLEGMQKKIEEKEGYYYEVIISPLGEKQNFDIYVTIDKKTGVVTDGVFGKIDREGKPQ